MMDTLIAPLRKGQQIHFTLHNKVVCLPERGGVQEVGVEAECRSRDRVGELRGRVGTSV